MEPGRDKQAGSLEVAWGAMLAAAPCPLIVVDADGLVEAASAATERLFGYGPGELCGRAIGGLIDARETPLPDGGASGTDRNGGAPGGRSDGASVRSLTEAAVGASAGASVGATTEAPDDAARLACLGILARGASLPGSAETGQRRQIGRKAYGVRRNGKRFPIEVTVGKAIAGGPAPPGDVPARPRLMLFVRDLTEHQAMQARLRELQEDLVHVSRLRAMGQMAAALSHELNQPLTATTNYLNAASRIIDQREPDLARVRQAVSLAAQQTMRSGEIIRRLRAFVARGEVIRRAESIGRIVEEATALALVDARMHGVTFTLDASSELPLVLVDRVQIQQVLMNLVRNAVEAMDGMAERVMSVDATLWDSMVSVSVYDTGLGIPPAIEAQLFQPFVTTKRDGMGIGLSVCRTIVEAHGGRLWAESRPSGGTVFRFTVPLAPTDGRGEAAG